MHASDIYMWTELFLSSVVVGHIYCICVGFYRHQDVGGLDSGGWRWDLLSSSSQL